MWSSTSHNEDPQKMVVYGVVSERVNSVRLSFDGDMEQAVPLSADDGFIYVISKAAIRPSDVPNAILTFDADGRLIETTPLGVTFGP